MLELLKEMDQETLIPLAGVIFGTGTAVLIVVTKVVSTNLRQYRERELAANIVHNMLDTGCSTEEIERVLKAAGMDGRRHHAFASSCDHKSKRSSAHAVAGQG